jgi:CRP/FNR family transcriptional regulator
MIYIADTVLEKIKDLFEPELIQEIRQHGRQLSVKTGDVVIDIGQAIKQSPIVLSGSLKVARSDEEGRELLLYYINAGESCAMTFTCCMQQYPSEIRAVAEEDSEILLIPISMMDAWLSKYATWKSFVMKTIRGRFNELLKTIDQVAFQKLDERLINYLKERSKTSGSSLINLSHQQIADDLATSRVVISRLLKKLENDNRLLLYRNQIKLLSGM